MNIKKKLSRGLVYQLALLVIKLAGFLPAEFNFKLGEILGWLGFWLIAKERKDALKNLQLALGDKYSPAELKKIAVKSFQQLGRGFFEVIEFCYYMRLKPADFIDIHGLEHLDQALSRGKGVIFVSAHLGNWELLSLATASLGYPVNIIVRTINNEGINRLMLQIRQQNKINIIERKKRGKISKSIFKVLLKNQLLGIMMDQDSRVDGVFVDFFGHPAYTPVGAVGLALATGATIIPVFIVRDAHSKHKMEMLPPMELKTTDNKQQDILINTQAITTIIEDYIRRFPEQWVWIHRRWKRQPKK